MTAKPRVSVLLPVYGNEPFLSTALDTLSTQTFTDFEIIAVTEDISELTRYALEEASVQIREIEYCGDEGLAGALNAGLDRCQGEYVARMDADDLSLPDRLETQVEMMDANPEIGVLGGGYERIDAYGTKHGQIFPPQSHLAIRWQLLLTSCIPHPTAMIRRAVLENSGIKYRPEFNAAEDYDLWTRLAAETTLRNLDNPLIQYRIAGERKSERDAERQHNRAEEIAYRTIERDLETVSFAEAEVCDMKDFLYHGASKSIRKRETAANCLDLFAAFEAEYGQTTTIKDVKREFSARLTRALLRPPIQLRSLEHLLRLARINPLFPASFAADILRRRTSLVQ